jgi:hypothetical protein
MRCRFITIGISGKTDAVKSEGEVVRTLSIEDGAGLVAHRQANELSAKPG